MPHTIREESVRINLRCYLKGKLSLEKFYRWLVPYTWDVHLHATESLCRLVYGIKGRLAEYSNGHWTPEELKQRFRELLGED